jgi:hypothetical protein
MKNEKNSSFHSIFNQNMVIKCYEINIFFQNKYINMKKKNLHDCIILKGNLKKYVSKNQQYILYIVKQRIFLNQ